MFEWLKGKVLFVLAGVCAVLLIALIAVGSYSAIQGTKIEKLGEDLTRVSGELEAAQKGLKDAVESAKVTDKVVSENNTTKQETKAKTESIKAQVDDASKKRAKNEIDDGTYRASLSNSMWNAYCQAKPDDSACASKHPAD